MQQEFPLSEETSTPQGISSDIASRRITRRAHRKSRAGCTNCKSRRIKCDEARPRCANCERRQILSSCITGQPPPHTPCPLGHQVPQCGRHLWKKSRSIINTFFISCSQSLSLHLAHCRATRRATANRYYEIALTCVTRAIANINADNCDAILLSVQLVCFVSWARGPQPGEYLAFGEHGRSEWLVMFRGIRTSLESFGQQSFLKRHDLAAKAKSRPLASTHEPMGYESQLSELREHVSIASPPSQTEENVRAVHILQECYSNRYRSIDSEYHVAFAWLYKMSDGFLDQLQRCEPLALIIYAHFVVLMHDMERFWYMKGWTHHVMSGILKAIETEHRAWIKWPMAKVGWMAP